MDKLKERFKNDPIFATSVMIASAYAATALLRAAAKVVESSAYAYRASKLV